MLLESLQTCQGRKQPAHSLVRVPLPESLPCRHTARLRKAILRGERLPTFQSRRIFGCGELVVDLHAGAALENPVPGGWVWLGKRMRICYNNTLTFCLRCSHNIPNTVSIKTGMRSDFVLTRFQWLIRSAFIGSWMLTASRCPGMETSRF
jgi:hypothetical protein